MHSSLQPYLDRVASGAIDAKEHGDLILFDYSRKCGYEKMWDDYTRAARGMVFNKITGEKVAHCLPKFFNLNEMPETELKNLPKGFFRAFEKMDGSCGIVYFYNGEWRVNTRGSFSSEQAIEAKKMLAQYDMSKIPENITLITEIIYPENKIVVNYNDRRELVLLTAFITRTGDEINGLLEEFSRLTGMRTPKEFNIDINGMVELQKTLTKDEEGFVVWFDNGLRVKIKGDQYMAVHKAISNLSPIALWENMSKGRIRADFLAHLPEEFRNEYEEIQHKLEYRYRQIMAEIMTSVLALPLGNFELSTMTRERRKELALFIKNNDLKHPNIIFPFLGSQYGTVENYIMQQIYPKGNVISQDPNIKVEVVTADKAEWDKIIEKMMLEYSLEMDLLK